MDFDTRTIAEEAALARFVIDPATDALSVQDLTGRVAPTATDPPTCFQMHAAPQAQVTRFFTGASFPFLRFKGCSGNNGSPIVVGM